MGKNPINLELGRRLEEVIGKESVVSFSKRCRISDSLLGSYIRGEKAPGLGRLITIANVGEVTVDWLATGRLPKARSQQTVLYTTPHESTSLSLKEPPLGYMAIPLYNDVYAAAGAGAVNTVEQPDDALLFKEDWIRVELGARPQDLRLIRVSGDSMEPTLRSGDVVLIDHRESKPTREGIYIIRMEEVLLVKRLQALPGGKFHVTSDNPVFQPWTIEPEDFEQKIAIIGRVVWSGRRL